MSIAMSVNGDLTALTVGHHLHAGLQEVGGRQLEGLAAQDQTLHHLAVLAVPQGLVVAVSTGPHSQTGLRLHLR